MRFDDYSSRRAENLKHGADGAAIDSRLPTLNACVPSLRTGPRQSESVDDPRCGETPSEVWEGTLGGDNLY